MIGGGAAIALFALAQLTGDRLLGRAGGEQFAALFGSASIGALGYLAVVVQIGVIAVITAAASRYTVQRTIETIDHWIRRGQVIHHGDLLLPWPTVFPFLPRFWPLRI